MLDICYTQAFIMSNTRRFALVLTNDSRLARWQIHCFDCADVAPLVSAGAFVDYVSAASPSALIRAELASQPKFTSHDYEIMSCCGTDSQISSAKLP
jgi:hypothetical protein